MRRICVSGTSRILTINTDGTLTDIIEPVSKCTGHYRASVCRGGGLCVRGGHGGRKCVRISAYVSA